MAVSLKKGQKVDLTKGREGLNKIRVELGWDTNRYSGNQQFDLDCSVFLLNPLGKVRSDGDFIFYNNKQSDDNSVIYGGDNRTGAGDGADEVVKIDLPLISQSIDKIAFTVTIDEYEERRQNFGMVENAYIKVINDQTNEVLIEYDLDEDYSIESAVVIAEMYRAGNEWKFNAIGSGFDGGLSALCSNYGIATD